MKSPSEETSPGGTGDEGTADGRSNFSRAYRILRAASGLRQEKVASLLGITAPHLSMIESGKRQPTTTLIDKAAEIFDIPPPGIMQLATSSPESLTSTPFAKSLSLLVFQKLLSLEKTRPATSHPDSA